MIALQFPTLVLGPFGVGKTHTLSDCIKLITWNFLDSHILICTHSNSAANLYVSDIHSEWLKRGNQTTKKLIIKYLGLATCISSKVCQNPCQ